MKKKLHICRRVTKKINYVYHNIKPNHISMKKIILSILAVMFMALTANAGTKTIVWDNATMQAMEIHRTLTRNFSELNEVFAQDGIFLSIRGVKDKFINVENTDLETNGTLVFQSSVGKIKRIEIHAATTTTPAAEWNTDISGIYWKGDARSVDLRSSDPNVYLTLTGLSKISFLLEDNEVAINETNFPDANFRNWLLGQSYGTDGVLLESEIVNVKSIAVYNQNIQSLKGIEYFTALTDLSCSNNSLTTLDVSGNKALTGLHCQNNLLTTLDVSACKNLSTLECYCNQIKDKGMDALVESLPKSSYRYMNVIYNMGEQNVMTKAQVAAAKAKGWTPLWRNPSTYNWSEYEGSGEPDPSEGVVINETNFPDANFRNWLTSQSYGADNVLTDSEIENVKEITITDRYVQSLKGIEYFTALTKLFCYRNQLTELDVSKNTALTNLNCSDNQLVTLDVSKNTALTILGCGNNQLTALDVSKNTALTNLSCYGNRLTTLDVSSCTMLNQLSCYSNQIKDAGMDALVNSLPAVNDCSLYVRYNRNEQNVINDAQVAIAKAKGWKPLWMDPNYGWREYEGGGEPDPSEGIAINETNFPDARFRNWLTSQSYGYDNLLTQSEIENIKEITITDRYVQSLKGIEYFTALTKLFCYRNQLTELDVSKNTALTNLSCSDNQLTTLDVSKNTALTILGCGNNQLTKLDVSKNTALINLSCYGNRLATLDVSNSPMLTQLSCYSNQIKGLGMDAMVNSLPTVSNGSVSVLYNRNEQNVMNTIQVAAAKAKGWTPQWLDPSYGWREYEGSEPESDVISDTVIVRPAAAAIAGTATTVSGITTSLSSEDEVNPEEGSVTMHTAMTTDEVNQLMETVDPSSLDFSDTFKGIYFQLAPGKGTIELDVETLGSFVMSVMKGNSLLGNYTQTTKGTIVIKYDLDADTWFFVYPAVNASSNTRRFASSDGGLKVYGVRITPDVIYDPVGINEIKNEKTTTINEGSVYNLAGQRVSVNALTQKGMGARIYILNGKKIVMK